jgi:hypothetical protein
MPHITKPMAMIVAISVLRGNSLFSERAKEKMFATMFKEKRTSVTMMYSVTANDIFLPF